MSISTVSVYLYISRNFLATHATGPYLSVIPKPSASDKEGLVIGWPTKPTDMSQLKELAEKTKAKLEETSK